MKKTDIVVGTEYAASRSNDYRFGNTQVERVKVVGPAYTKPSRSYLDSAQSLVPVDVWSESSQSWVHSQSARQTRHIRETWSTWSEHLAELDKSKQERRDRANAARNERAGLLLHLIPALRWAGVPDTTQRLTRRGPTIQALEAHIPDCLEVKAEGERTEHYELTAPLAGSIEAYVRSGTPFDVDAETLLKLASWAR